MENSANLKVAVLAAIVTLGAIVSYFSFLISPLRKQRASLSDQLAKLEEQIDLESTELKRLRAAEDADQQNGPLDGLVDRMLKTAPRNPALSAPDLLINTFRMAESEKVETFLYMMLPFKIDPSYLVYEFNVKIPKADALQFGSAVAGFEQKNPLAQITELSLESTEEDPSTPRAAMVIQMIVRP